MLSTIVRIHCSRHIPHGTCPLAEPDSDMFLSVYVLTSGSSRRIAGFLVCFGMCVYRFVSCSICFSMEAATSGYRIACVQGDLRGLSDSRKFVHRFTSKITLAL